jgi:hypothetical protein
MCTKPKAGIKQGVHHSTPVSAAMEQPPLSRHPSQHLLLTFNKLYKISSGLKVAGLGFRRESPGCHVHARGLCLSAVSAHSLEAQHCALCALSITRAAIPVHGRDEVLLQAALHLEHQKVHQRLGHRVLHTSCLAYSIYTVPLSLLSPKWPFANSRPSLGGYAQQRCERVLLGLPCTGQQHHETLEHDTTVRAQERLIQWGCQAGDLQVGAHNVKIALHQQPRDLHLHLLLLRNAGRHPQRLHIAMRTVTACCFLQLHKVLGRLR